MLSTLVVDTLIIRPYRRPVIAFGAMLLSFLVIEEILAVTRRRAWP